MAEYSTNEYLGGASLIYFLDKLQTQLKEAVSAEANKSLPSITTIMEYDASSTSTQLMYFEKEYDILLLCATPSKDSSSIFLTVPIDDDFSNDSTKVIDVADDQFLTSIDLTRTDQYLSLYRTSGSGYIRAVYGLKIGGLIQ